LTSALLRRNWWKSLITRRLPIKILLWNFSSNESNYKRFLTWI
jgi:hypothetical protein